MEPRTGDGVAIGDGTADRKRNSGLEMELRTRDGVADVIGSHG